MIENFGHALGGMAQDRGRARLQALVDRRQGIRSPDELRADLAEWQAAHTDVNQKLEAQIKVSRVNAAMYAGSQEQVKALKAALAAVSPNNPLLQITTQRDAEGKPKSKLLLLYEAGFDAWLRARNINPVGLRKE